MPKLKTRKAVKKRFRFSKKGKLKMSRAFKGHLLTGKSGKRKRILRKKKIVGKTEESIIKRLMPYG